MDKKQPVVYPYIPNSELVVKQQMLDEIGVASVEALYEDIPEEKIHDMNSELVLKGSGTSNSVLGTEESVKNINRDLLINYYKSRYTKENTLICVAGNIDVEKIMAQLEGNFKDFERELDNRDYNKNFIIKLNSKEAIIKMAFFYLKIL